MGVLGIPEYTPPNRRRIFIVKTKIKEGKCNDKRKDIIGSSLL